MKFLDLNTEHIRDTLKGIDEDENEMEGMSNSQTERQKHLITVHREKLLELVSATNLLEINSKILIEMSKRIDQDFLQHICSDVMKKDLKNYFTANDSSNMPMVSMSDTGPCTTNNEENYLDLLSSVEKLSQGSSAEKEKDRLAERAKKSAFILRVAYLQTSDSKLNTTVKSDFTDAEFLAKKAMKSNNPDLFSDTRHMRGLMLLLLGVLDNVLDGMTSLQTSITVQWRILRVFSYAFIAAKRTLSKSSNNNDQNSRYNSSMREEVDKSRRNSIRNWSSGGKATQSSTFPKHPDETLLFSEANGTTGYIIEFFSHGHGIVTLCKILSNTYKIRILAASGGIAMASTNNASSYQVYQRPDAIYFTQNNHAPERYATTAVLFLLEWLITRLKTESDMRLSIRKMVRSKKMSMKNIPKLESYSNTMQRCTAWDTVLALKVLSSCPSDSCCGNGTLIADLASKIVECSLEQLKPPSPTVIYNVLDHLKAIQEGRAVLNHGRWKSDTMNKDKPTNRDGLSGLGSEQHQQWWEDPLATHGFSPYDVDSKLNRDDKRKGMLVFLGQTTESKNNVQKSSTIKSTSDEPEAGSSCRIS